MRGAASWARAILVLLAASCCDGCHRKRPEPARPAASAREALPSAPRELIVEGALGEPAEAWRSVRDLVGGHALAVPATFPLAVTTVIGASPLVAGLVDDTAPLALAFVDAGGSIGLVAGVHVTSGPELIAALATGSDARFSSEPGPAPSVTLLSPKGAVSGLALAVAGDTLLLAARREPLQVAAAYVGQTLRPALEGRHGLTLSVGRAALAGPLAAAIGARFSEVVRSLSEAAARAAAEHGRAPDFGNPSVVIDALAALGDAATQTITSAAEVRLSAALEGPIPEIRVELVPRVSGAARELVRDLAVGDASALLSLPEWTDAALLFRRSSGAEGGGVAARLSAVFGDRLGKADRVRFLAFGDEVGRALGGEAVLGIFGGDGGASVFALGPSGDGASLGRAVLTGAELLRTPAITAPFVGAGGRLDVVRKGAGITGADRETALSLRRVGGGARPGDSPPFTLDVVAASRGARVVVVGARKDAESRVAELLSADSARRLASDPVALRAVSRVGGNGAALALSRFHDASGRAGLGVLSIGSDRRIAWAELTLSDVAARALATFVLASSSAPEVPPP